MSDLMHKINQLTRERDKGVPGAEKRLRQALEKLRKQGVSRKLQNPQTKLVTEDD